MPLAVLTPVATIWALGWGVLGFWLILRAPGMAELGGVGVKIPLALRWIGGLTAIAAGQIVMMIFVADRLFPMAWRRLVLVGEVAVSLVLLVGTLVTALACVSLYLFGESNAVALSIAGAAWAEGRG